jgi:hypothetical protein
MAKYIEFEDAYRTLSDYYHHSTDNQHMALREALDRVPAADVVERKTGKNVATEYDDCDQFVCSECGIELQDWRRVERDEDGLEVYHEYRLRFCPSCGAKIKGVDENV